MGSLKALIIVHVGAGAAWVLVSLAVAVRRGIGRWLLALQAVAVAATLAAGILLWHLLHASGMGPVEHRLVVGTLCAFVALGLQIGVQFGILGLRGKAPLAAGGLAIYWASVVFLGFAAAAMIASRLA